MAELLPYGLGNSMRYGANAPYNMLGNRPISNGTMLSPGYTTGMTSGVTNPYVGGLGSVSAAQPSTQSNGSTLGTLGAIGSALGPIGTAASIGLGVAGFFDDRAAAKRAEAEQERQLDAMRAARDFNQQRYISELDKDAARRGMLLRGQVANTPAYQAMQSNLARQGNLQQQSVADQMEKSGLGNKSGMSAQLASQNISNLGKTATMGAANQMNTSQRVYGGLGPYAMTTTPEKTEYDRQQGIYGEASDYGSNLAPIFDLLSTGAKYGIGNAYRGQMMEDIQSRANAGYGLGRSGGNV